jgi:hypothetical protein
LSETKLATLLGPTQRDLVSELSELGKVEIVRLASFENGLDKSFALPGNYWLAGGRAASRLTLVMKAM